jgi:broad specificity phosphatase PhoE
LTTVYMFRHGQAGDRARYDTLSPLGEEQARLLGRFLSRNGLRFDAVYCGALERQQITCRLVCEAFASEGRPLPEPFIDDRWNEFDIGRVFEEMATQLAANDEGFRRHYDELRQCITVPDSDVHRQWTRADNLTVQAWINQTYPYTGETWDQFTCRVLSCRQRLAEHGDDARVAVFTSATPIAIWMGAAHHLPANRVMELASIQVNSSYSTYRLTAEETRLVSFNEKPHLTEDRLLTCR